MSSFIIGEGHGEVTLYCTAHHRSVLRGNARRKVKTHHRTAGPHAIYGDCLCDRSCSACQRSSESRSEESVYDDARFECLHSVLVKSLRFYSVGIKDPSLCPCRGALGRLLRIKQQKLHPVSPVGQKSSDSQAVCAVIAGACQDRNSSRAALSIRTIDGIPITCDVFASASAISCPVSRYFIVPSSPCFFNVSGIFLNRFH